MLFKFLTYVFFFFTDREKSHIGNTDVCMFIYKLMICNFPVTTCKRRIFSGHNLEKHIYMKIITVKDLFSKLWIMNNMENVYPY